MRLRTGKLPDTHSTPQDESTERIERAKQLERAKQAIAPLDDRVQALSEWERVDKLPLYAQESRCPHCGSVAVTTKLDQGCVLYTDFTFSPVKFGPVHMRRDCQNCGHTFQQRPLDHADNKPKPLSGDEEETRQSLRAKIDELFAQRFPA